MTMQQFLLDGAALVRPGIKVGAAGTALPAEIADRISAVAVDLQLSVPDMFEIRFRDPAGNMLAKAGLDLATPVEIWGTDNDGAGSYRIIAGEVTAIEGDFVEGSATAVVRGYTLDHRLQRTRHTRTFLAQKDSEIARTLAQQAGLRIGTVDATTDPVGYVVQANQTDWEFLTRRAREIGYEVGVVDSAFYFRKASTTAGTPVQLSFGAGLRQFHPRVSAGNLAPETEVRVWDPVQAKVIASRHTVQTTTVATHERRTPAATAKTFLPPAPATPGAAAGTGADMGPPPSPGGAIVVDLPLPVTGGSDAAPTQAAQASAMRLASTFAEADGECLGDARILAGSVLSLDRLPERFAGRWVVTRARHVFDPTGSGYRTSFNASGGQDRSLLGLATPDTASRRSTTGVPGLACAVVTNIKDPQNLGRLKVSLPWLSPTHESDWAPVAQLFAGVAEGAMFLPSPGDQVLVGFEFGDLRRPYVLGSLPSTHTAYGLDGSQGGSTAPGSSGVQATGEAGAVVRRGWITPGGTMLVFHDQVPPSGKGRPIAADVALASTDQKIGLTMDQVAGSVRLTCSPETPGTLTIECSGAIQIKAGAEGSLTIDGGTRLSLKGQTVEINGTGPVAVKGKPIQLN